MNKYLLCLLVSCILYACSVKKEEKIQAFWIWFDKNKSHFENLTYQEKDIKQNMLQEQLRNIEPGLTVELFTDLKQLIISAQGDTSKFSIVQEIVQKAPKFVDWDVTAFRQPTLENFTLQYENISLTPAELYFLPIEENDKLDIIVYGLGFRNYNSENLTYYGKMMLDKVMGEYNCATKVRFYDFKDLQDIKNNENLIPLTEINDFVEAFHAARQEKNI